MSFVEDLKKELSLKGQQNGSVNQIPGQIVNTMPSAPAAAQAAPAKPKAKFTQDDVEAIVAKAVAEAVTQTLAKVQANQVGQPPITIQSVPLTHWHLYQAGVAKDGHQYTAGCSWYANELPQGTFRKSKGISIDAIVQILMKYGGKFDQLEREWTEGAEKYGKMSYVYNKAHGTVIDLNK